MPLMTPQNLKFMDFTKTQKSWYLEKKKLVFFQIKKINWLQIKGYYMAKNSFVADITFKTRFSVFPLVTCWRVVVFCVFNKKRKVFVVEENSGLLKRELWKYDESSPILVFEGSVKRNSIIMVSKGYQYVINQVLLAISISV